MGNILILNGSPRAPRSNSRHYAEIFMEKCLAKTDYFDITAKNHRQLCGLAEEYSDLLVVFPLYVDSLPVSLLNFLKSLEQASLSQKPVLSAVINCGFLEPFQNDSAVEMLRLFCRQNHYPFGSVLSIGGGEAILNTPFRFLAVRKLRRLASSICAGKYRSFQVTMPLSRKMFLKAAESYWLRRGRENGVGKEEMETMQIEPQTQRPKTGGRP